MDNQQNTPQETQVDQPQRQPSKNKKKKVIIISLIVVLVLVAFGGLYYWQNSKNQELQKQIDTLEQRQKSAATTQQREETTIDQTVTELTLDQAVTATQTVYNKLLASWGQQAEVSFVKNNASLFTTSFVQNTSTNGGQYPLACNAKVDAKPSSIEYKGVTATPQAATVNVTYMFAGQGNSYSLLNVVNLKAQDGKWLISGLTCPSNFSS